MERVGKERVQRYKVAAADARSTKEVEDGKHISGGVMIAVKQVDPASGKVEGLEEKDGKIAQIW